MSVQASPTDRVLAALARAGYPCPQAMRGEGYTVLVWGWNIPGTDQPQITVFDDGSVTVTIDRHPDAVVHVDEIAAWLRVLWPRIAEIVAHSMIDDPIAEPPLLPWASLPPFAYLYDDPPDGVYATFVDQSRLWVSAADSHAAIDVLLGTVQGYQLGITLTTTIAVATRTGTIYLNPDLARPTAIAGDGGYFPALAVAGAIFSLPHPTHSHHVAPEPAVTAAATRLHTILATQAHNGHIYPHNG